MRIETPTPDPSKLLEAFLASGRSERAFADLVGSLNRLVHSAALRRTGHAQLSEEVSQNVFTILARKAPSLRNHPCLEAWAMETTRLEARTVLRSEKRRQGKTAAFARETQALSSTPTEPMDSHENWQDALPLLDDALESLPMKDRRLIIERFYRDKKFGEIAAATGQTEGACKKRIKRALDKLSSLLTARGATLSATGIAYALGTELARSAPSQAAALMAPKALAAASSISTTTILTNTLLTMSYAKITTVTAAVVIAIIAFPFAHQRAEGRKIQEKLARLETPSALSATSSLATKSKLRTVVAASDDETRSPRRILLSLLSDDPVTRQRARDQVANMNEKERAALLEAFWRFPRQISQGRERSELAMFLLDSNDGRPPGKILDSLVASGHYSAITGHLGEDNPLTLWAKEDPAAAAQWFESKLGDDTLFIGLSDEKYAAIYSHLMEGTISADPAQALELYMRLPQDIRDIKSEHSWPIKDLTKIFAKHLITTNNDAIINKLLVNTQETSREIVISEVTRQYSFAGQLDEGLAFVGQHIPEAAIPSPVRDRHVCEIASNSREAVGLEKSLDWLLAEVSNPDAAVATVATTFDSRGIQCDITQVPEAMRWLARQPPGKPRDAAQATIAWQCTIRAAYDDAIAAATNIDDASIRGQMVKTIEESRQIYKDTEGDRTSDGSSLPLGFETILHQDWESDGE